METPSTVLDLETLRDKFDKFLKSRRWDSADVRRSLSIAVFQTSDEQAGDDLGDPFGSPYSLIVKHIRSVVCYDILGNTWYLKLDDDWTATTRSKVHEIGLGVVQAYVDSFNIPEKAWNKATKGIVHSSENSSISFCKSICGVDSELKCKSILLKMPVTPFTHKFKNGTFDIYGAPADDSPVFGCCPVNLQLHEDQAEWEKKHMRPYATCDEEYAAFEYIVGYICSGMSNVERCFCFAGVTGSGKSTIVDIFRLWWHFYSKILKKHALLGKRDVEDQIMDLVIGKVLAVVPEVDNANLSNGKARQIQTGVIKSFTDSWEDSQGEVHSRTGNLLWNMNVNHQTGLHFNVIDDDQARNSLTRRILFVWFANERPEATGFKKAICPEEKGDIYHKERAIRFCFNCVRKYYEATEENGAKLHELVFPAWQQKFEELLKIGKSASASTSTKWQPNAAQVQVAKEFVNGSLEKREFKDWEPYKGVKVNGLLKSLLEYAAERGAPLEIDPANRNQITRLYLLLETAGFEDLVSSKKKASEVGKSYYYFHKWAAIEGYQERLKQQIAAAKEAEMSERQMETKEEVEEGQFEPSAKRQCV